MARLTRRRSRSGMSLYRPLEAAPGDAALQAASAAASRSTLSDSLPMLEHMGMKVLDEHPHRDRAARRGADLDARLRPAVARRRRRGRGRRAARGVRGRVRARLPRRGRERRLQPPGARGAPAGATRSWCCAPTRSTCGRSASRCRRRSSRRRWPRTPASRACSSSCSSCASIRTRRGRARRASATRCARSRHALEKVDNLSEDRVLRQYLALILATTRTNFWRRDAARPAARASCRSSSIRRRCPACPSRSRCSRSSSTRPRFEGVHLRGGKVARGGLRWSDRPEDFRTEVLGLVKAQMVKNTVIVPVGSKGGFVLKTRAAGRATARRYMKEGVACYQDYLRGLLDITDNRVGDTIVPPPQVRRHDPDDPVPRRRRRQGHGDVLRLRQRHQQGVRLLARRRVRLRRLGGLRPQGDGHHRARRVGVGQAPFPRDGHRHADDRLHRRRHRRHVGRRVRQRHAAVARTSGCVAAFDHRHIFLDPEPGCRRRRFAERERLFKLPRSSWADYDAKLISAGGGVHARSAKSIAISPRGAGGARHRRRRADADRARQRDPQGAGRPALQRRHRHLRQGGERNARAGRRPRQRRAARQRPRAALQGRRRRRQSRLHAARPHRVRAARAAASTPMRSTTRPASTPRTTRSTSRSCSGCAIADGELTEKQRNALLAEMTDDVAALVLRDNYFQTQALSVDRPHRAAAARCAAAVHAATSRRPGG